MHVCKGCIIKFIQYLYWNKKLYIYNRTQPNAVNVYQWLSTFFKKEIEVLECYFTITILSRVPISLKNSKIHFVFLYLLISFSNICISITVIKWYITNVLSDSVLKVIAHLCLNFVYMRYHLYST